MRLKINKSDILGVLQVIDLDGCMIDNDKVIINDCQLQDTYYEDDFIKVKSINQKKYIENKNTLKTSEVRRMIEYKYIGTYKYQIYYFARTMEHVIFNEANPDDSTKVYNINKFMTSLNCAIEDFLSNYLPPLKSDEYNDKYKESWAYPFLENNSLHRCNNVSLLFEFAKDLINSNEERV